MKPMMILIITACLAVALARPAQSSPLSRQELSIWNDAAFKKDFAESYMAESDIEPRVSTVEREQMQKILTLMAQDKVDEAAQLLEKNRGEKANALYDFMLANIYFQQDKLDEAASAYEQAVGKFTKFRRAWRNLGLIHVRRGEFEKALPALTKVIELGGGDALTYGLLGYAYSSVDNSLSAESAYRMAILLDPLTMDWKMGLARSLFKQENFAQAAALCAQLIAQEPERTDLWLLQANAYIGLKQPMKAAENYELVDRLGKSTSDSLNMLGDIYINEELFDMAVDSYVRAMGLDPEAKPQRSIRAAKVLTARGANGETHRLLTAMTRSSPANWRRKTRKTC
jgi:tetratricopeptide (TPR) repeat protein